MGLDIYVGSFTRYYAGDWDTAVQSMGREQGLGVQVIRPNDSPDAVTDPDEVRAAILVWRDQLSHGLSSHIGGPFDWDETESAPYFTDKPAWDCYSSLLLWAAYCEHPELRRPFECIEDWTTDVAFQRSADPSYRTAFPQLLRDVEIWLPHNFSFTLLASDPAGQEICFGSSVALVKQLVY